MPRFITSVCAVLCAATALFGGESNRLIRVEGVIKTVMRDDLDVDWSWAEVQTPSSTIPVAVHRDISSYNDLRKTIDAEVRIEGYSQQKRRIPLPKSERIIATKPFEVLLPPPADPFSAPIFSSKKMSPHRMRMVGTVLASRRDRLFMRLHSPHDYAIKVALSNDALVPAVGAHIAAVGFVRTSSFSRYLSEALVKVVGEDTGDSGGEIPMDIDCDSLFITPNGSGKVNPRYFGKTVRVRGTAIGDFDEGDDGLVLKCGKHTLRIDMAFPDGSARRVKAGSTVEITGVCDLEFENSFGDTLFPHFRGFAILPRTAADVKVLAEPPWWTPFRLVCVIALLALALLATLAWNRSLAVISERKGRELYHEQIASAKAELKVEERTRLAVEIHDSLSQTLTGVSLQIDAAMRNGEKGFSAAERYLKTARQMLASCRHELRCCIWDLKSRTFEEKNMTEAVERMLAPHAEQTRISVRFNVPRTALSDSTTHAVLRIIRELTVNAVRHGKASNVRIAGEFVDGVVRFSVADDGAGFDPKSADGPAQGHFGLNGIRERLNEFNGKMEIESSPGKGTKATVTIKP